MREIRGLIQFLVYQSYRVNSVLALREHSTGARVVKMRSLKTEEARDDLKVVLHAMVDLLQQYLFLAKRCVNSLDLRAVVRVDELPGATAYEVFGVMAEHMTRRT